jgi:hypothetical protein
MNIANKQLDEMLEEVNNSADPESSLRLIIDKPYIKFYLSQLLSEDWVSFDVDDIKHEQYNYHRSMSGAILCNKQTANVYLSIFMKKEVVQKTKLFQCKSLLEMLNKGESDILKAILKKDLQSLYPNITYEIINKVV